jgi:DNA-binding NarL/FixJ family response regulator
VKILVIDDDPIQLDLVERSLRRDGFDVRCTTSPGRAGDEAARFGPEIVLVDVNIPGSPPAQMIDAIRRSAPGARYVLYSAWEESRLRALAREIKADGYISKSESVVTIARKLQTMQGAR